MRFNWVLAVALAGAGCSSDDGGATAPAQVFFGDVHAHSAFSAPDRVGNADPSEFYRIARDEIGLDFVALSDHDGFLTQQEWDEIRRVAPTFDEPGAFVAFSAIEWTHRWHMNILYQFDDVEFCQCIEAPGFYDHYRDMVGAGEAAAQVNHPVGTFLANWAEIDDSVTRNVEIFNAAAPDQENGFGGAIWSLRSGFRLGFVGVSDDHITDADSPLIGHGITGCHSGELTRSAILDALNDRRCYATTGERIVVDIEVNGTAMGGVSTAEIGATVDATVSVSATALPADVELVHNGVVVASGRCDDTPCTLDAEVDVVSPSNFVYARVRRSREVRAWSSPVWIDAGCADGTDGCLEARLASGGGSAEDDCLAEFIFPDDFDRGVAGIYDIADATVRCPEGDPTCDAGDDPDECLIRVGVCFEIDDARLPSCEAASADRFEVVEPGPEARRPSLDWQNRSTLEAIFQATHTGRAKNRCSGINTLRVPVGEQRSFRLATRSGSRIDTDRLTAECLAAR